MTPDRYMKEAPRTESLQYFPQNHRLEHAIDGIASESGELVDAIKKAKYYGKELDLTNLKEEGGDILWYLALMFDELGTTFEAEMLRNNAKLRSRFPDKFTEELATNRDLGKERAILEGGS